MAERLFSEGELAYAAARSRPGQHLAARFCAKEAVAKALGLPGWSFRDVEVMATPEAPVVRLSGAAQERARALGVQCSVSLTHTTHTAGAVALASDHLSKGTGGFEQEDCVGGKRFAWGANRLLKLPSVLTRGS